MQIKINSTFDIDDICLCKITYKGKKILLEYESIFCEKRLNYFKKEVENKLRNNKKLKTTKVVIIDMIRVVGSKAN